MVDIGRTCFLAGSSVCVCDVIMCQYDVSVTSLFVD